MDQYSLVIASNDCTDKPMSVSHNWGEIASRFNENEFAAYEEANNFQLD